MRLFPTYSAPRAVWLGLLLTVTLQPFNAAAAPPDPVAQFDFMRESQWRFLKQSMTSMPPLGGHEDHKLRDIFRLDLADRDLLLRTPLDSTLVPNCTRARVPEFSDPVMVRVVGGADHKKHAPGEPVVPDELLFQSIDYSKPHQITSLSLSQSGSAIFSLSQSRKSPTGSQTIEFLVKKIPNLPGGGVTLILTDSGTSADTSRSSTTLAAPDCATFLRREPRALGLYVMPMLAQLGQEGVLAPDAVLLSQVFPESFPPDAAIRRSVEALLPELDAADYHRRDQALEDLKQLGKDAAKVMPCVDRSKLTPEQNARLDIALTPVGLVPRAEAERLGHDKDFLVDCLFSDDPATRRWALVKIKAEAGTNVDLPETLTGPGRVAAINELRAKRENKR